MADVCKHSAETYEPRHEKTCFLHMRKRKNSPKIARNSWTSATLLRVKGDVVCAKNCPTLTLTICLQMFEKGSDVKQGSVVKQSTPRNAHFQLKTMFKWHANFMI